MTKQHKILVLNFGGIGDEILFLPTILSLRSAYPDSIITLAVEPRSSVISELSADIDELIHVNIKSKCKYWDLLKLLFKCRLEHYDIVISSGMNKSIPILLALTGAKKRYGYNSGFISEKLLTKAVTLNKNQYASKMYLDLISPLCEPLSEVPSIELEEIEKIPNSVLIHPGVSKMSIRKNIHKAPDENFWTELIELLLAKNKKVALAGGPDDDEIIKKIVISLKNKNLLAHHNFTNLFGKTISLKDLARKIKQAENFVCSDSAPMHIGVATGTKVFAIFGPTDEKKLLPDSELFKAITVDCDCRPCLWDKANQSCDRKTCLNFDAHKVVDLIQ